VLHIVDTVEVEPADVDAYVDVVHGLGVPVMADAGASLVSCGATPVGIGDPVCVQVVWAVDGFERWNEVRRDLVLDPRWYAYGARAAALRRDGTRRFFTARARPS
jgi:hypothetical protein